KDKGDILLVQVYIDDIIFGSTKKSLYVKFEQIMHKGFQMSSIGELTFFLGLHVKQKDDGIFISQDKYVADILKKFDFVIVKTASTPIETNKALLKDEEAKDVDVYLYRSMIGSLMYLIASRPDIMFVVCACVRDSSFNLEAFFDSDYAGASLDRKSTTGAEYVVAANCYGQVLWIQNQMLDYGFNFMNTKIHIYNESTICIVKNLVFHSKTKHIKIRHHFIRDSYEKRLIQVIKIHTDHNVADLLTKAFDVSSDEIRVKTGSCKVNAARQDLLLLGEINDVKQIHATVDGKTVVISESSVRSDLDFNDEDGITCLTNETIFENLALMGYESDSNKLTFQKALFSPQWKYLIHTILHCLSSKSTSWNEISTNIASAVICLANGQKINFSKLIFDGILRNLDTNTMKFLMYPRFLQLFLNNQISLVEPFNDIYKTHVHTKKVFTNMKIKGKDFSGKITPLFASMLAPPVVEGEGSGQPTEPQPAPSTTQPLVEEQTPVTESSSPKILKHLVKPYKRTLSYLKLVTDPGVNTPGSDEERIEHQELMDNIPPTPYDSPFSRGYTPESDEGRPDLHELMAICIKLFDRVLDLEKEKDAQAVEILKLKNRIKKLERKAKSSIPSPKRRLYKQVDSSYDSLGKENASKQGRNDSNKIEEFNLSDKGSGGTEVFDDTIVVEKDVNATEPVSTTGDAVTAASVIPNINTVRPLNVSAAGTSTSIVGDIFKDEMMTIANTLVAIRSTRPRTTLVVIHDVEEEPRRATPVPTVQSQDKEDQAQFEREQRIARERVIEQEAKDAALIAEFDNIIAERKRLFAAQRAEQIRNKPPTKTQLRNKMITYLKKMGRDTHNSEEGGKMAESSKKEAASNKKRQKAYHDDEHVKRQKLEDAGEK
ncbi:putative ribonuclease H-like domain-containing protein, partial [Tanacetum coccineum]